ASSFGMSLSRCASSSLRQRGSFSSSMASSFGGVLLGIAHGCSIMQIKLLGADVSQACRAQSLYRAISGSVTQAAQSSDCALQATMLSWAANDYGRRSGRTKVGASPGRARLRGAGARADRRVLLARFVAEPDRALGAHEQ